jgi:hypothetical protein
MSSEPSSDGPVARFVDTVTPAYVGRPNSEMHAIGLLLFGLLFVLLLPLLPLLAVLWIADQLATGRGPDVEPEVEPVGNAPPS